VAYNKLLKRDKLQLAGSAPLHILANYNLPLNRALCVLNMNPFHEIKTKLEKYPDVTIEEKESHICALAETEDGFDVWFTEDEREYTVGFSCWHEHFDKNELEEALNCFAWGLSEVCRLKVYSRAGSEYKWIVQSFEADHWVNFSTTSLFNFSFWKKTGITYKKNGLIET